jgi:RecJ-like exonuclease
MKTIVFPEECLICNGVGHLPCGYCKGTGRAILIAGQFYKAATSYDPDASTCPFCQGVRMLVCPECDGRGILQPGHVCGSGREKPVRPYYG